MAPLMRNAWATLASACGLPDLRLIRSFGNNFFRWRATGWQKPCMSAAGCG